MGTNGSTEPLAQFPGSLETAGWKPALRSAISALRRTRRSALQFQVSGSACFAYSAVKRIGDRNPSSGGFTTKARRHKDRSHRRSLLPQRAPVELSGGRLLDLRSSAKSVAQRHWRSRPQKRSFRVPRKLRPVASGGGDWGICGVFPDQNGIPGQALSRGPAQSSRRARACGPCGAMTVAVSVARLQAGTRRDRQREPWRPIAQASGRFR